VPNVRSLGARIVLLALVAFLLAPSSPAQRQQASNQDLRSAQEEDIREAAFLYLFDVGTGPDRTIPFTVCPWIQTDSRTIMQTGKAAWMISLSSITWVNDHKVRVGGTRYCGGLCGWWSTLQVTLRDGKWKATIAPGASIMVS